MGNIFASVPDRLDHEMFDELLNDKNIRIERIISLGHVSPESGWYDQECNEWVIVLEGSGTILFEDGREITLARGDYVNIPAHVRHRVARTDPGAATIWLAVHYR